MGAHLRRPGLQHPRGPTTLPRPKWGRVPWARTSLESGKPTPPVRWSLTNSRASLVINLRAWKGFSKELGGKSARAFSLHSMLEWLAVERVRTRLREAGWKGNKKHEFEPVRASRRILRCSQRGQPPARRDVRWHRPSTGEQGAQATVEWAPSVDVLQKDGDLVVRVEMPGVKPEDVHVAVHNRVLTISGERKVDEEEER